LGEQSSQVISEEQKRQLLEQERERERWRKKMRIIILSIDNIITALQVIDQTTFLLEEMVSFAIYFVVGVGAKW